MRNIMSIAVIALFLAGCSHAISRESLDLVDQNISFGKVKENPAGVTGKYVLLGGIIAGVENSAAGGELEIVQIGLDWLGRPADGAPSEGRFIARNEKFLDPVVFAKGLAISLVGRVDGTRSKSLGGTEYTYPVVTIRELRILQPGESWNYPTFHFGIGIGHTF